MQQIGLISPGFDVNDAGFMYYTDEINGHIVLGYQWFQPDGLFRSKSFNVATFRKFNFLTEMERPGEGIYIIH